MAAKIVERDGVLVLTGPKALTDVDVPVASYVQTLGRSIAAAGQRGSFTKPRVEQLIEDAGNLRDVLEVLDARDLEDEVAEEHDNDAPAGVVGDPVERLGEPDTVGEPQDDTDTGEDDAGDTPE